ncbi:ribbon-helix-helix protein, CopG family [Carnobacterium divergens]
MKDKKNEHITIRISENELKKLNRKAKSLHVSRSEAVRQLIKYLTLLQKE